MLHQDVLMWFFVYQIMSLHDTYLFYHLDISIDVPVSTYRYSKDRNEVSLLVIRWTLPFRWIRELTSRWYNFYTYKRSKKTLKRTISWKQFVFTKMAIPKLCNWKE